MALVQDLGKEGGPAIQRVKIGLKYPRKCNLQNRRGVLGLKIILKYPQKDHLLANGGPDRPLEPLIHAFGTTKFAKKGFNSCASWLH